MSSVKPYRMLTLDSFSAAGRRCCTRCIPAELENLEIWMYNGAAICQKAVWVEPQTSK